MTLRAMRQNLGLNQSQFWSRIGIGQSGGSRYESGSRKPPRPVQMLISIAYGSAKEKRAVLKQLGA